MVCVLIGIRKRRRREGIEERQRRGGGRKERGDKDGQGKMMIVELIKIWKGKKINE